MSKARAEEVLFRCEVRMQAQFAFCDDNQARAIGGEDRGELDHLAEVYVPAMEATDENESAPRFLKARRIRPQKLMHDRAAQKASNTVP